MISLDSLRANLLRILPHHAISRLTHWLARRELPGIAFLLKLFVRRYRLNMAEAVETDLVRYRSFNALFTRPLKPQARPLDAHPDALSSPADAIISAFGIIAGDQIFQAKRHRYSVAALLGGDETLAAEFQDGYFLTVYLSPKDYHRVHMPLDGRLRHMLHIPGRLFSVAPGVVERVPGLYARNERVVTIFDTRIGPMAMALIGAINVGSIETVWAGEVTPPRGRRIGRWDYSDKSIQLARGAEMGRFNLGSSVVLLLPKDAIEFLPACTVGGAIRVRETLAHCTTRWDPSERPPQAPPDR